MFYFADRFYNWQLTHLVARSNRPFDDPPNLAPQVALHEIARLIPKLKPRLRGAVLTLKLNDWSFVDELPKLRDRILAMGFRDVQMRHLPSNRKEICAIARS